MRDEGICAMKYYLHLLSHDDLDVDHNGMELPSLTAARREVRRTAKEMVPEILHEEPVDGSTFEIADGEGAILATVPFANSSGWNREGQW